MSRPDGWKPFEEIGRFVLFTFRAATTPLRSRLRGGLVVRQMSEIGIKSLPVVSVTGLFTGMVLAFTTAYQIRRFGAEVSVGGIVAVALTRELAPVLTALVVAGRVGAAITAEIGTMKVTEQVDALESMGVDPAEYLAWPRLAAAIFMLPILTIYADFIGYIGGSLVGVHRLGLPAASFVRWTRWLVVPSDILSGLGKTLVFGAIIGSVATYVGLATRGGAEGVGRATTTSVVTSMLLVFGANYLLTSVIHLVLG